MKSLLLAAALSAALAQPAVQNPPPAPPCGFASVPEDFAVTFKNKGLVSDLINLLNDAPMREADRAVMRAAVFGEMNTAVDAWCAAHAKHK